MYPKAYLFHDADLEGLDHLISSPITLTFGVNQLCRNKKSHIDLACALNLYNACNKPIYPNYVTCIYDSKPQEILATILKFNISEYCYIKSDKHFTLAKSLVNINRKLEGTMQNISGLESNMRTCYKILETFNLQMASPLDYQEIESMSHVLSVRKVARLKLNDLIRKEFIDNICQYMEDV
ncbi:hypothetical protein [Polynucleobacter sp. UK-Gri1-W3]|uniref:hypothetical protein n=1 Tax=Polynucleobacter sp. UK-Gri1-W3 TaxID=1819737 RepID=UPI001C0D71EC|nr:hypothetical protein [Polynucleobacter sp. UK-Gri1-W3]MBU3537648.1 hypothetical protein [Polynucleobacter sp. UK-Gri1-W3]